MPSGFLNDAANRAAFKHDEDAHCAHYGLNDEQRAAIKARNVLHRRPVAPA